MRTGLDHAVETIAPAGFRVVERLLPIVIALMSVGAAAIEIVLKGKDMAPEKILFEAGATLLLALAAVIIVRAGKA